MTLPSGTVTFLFTDIEGSTKLAQEYPDAMPALLARHHEILNQSIQAYNGYIFQIVGDSFAVAFHSASDAVNSALDAQRLLQNESWSPAPIRARMGIHTATSHLNDASAPTTYSGYATLAATQRIMSAGHGRQILLSGATHELVCDMLPADAELVDLGEKSLKDLMRPTHLYQLNAVGLTTTFPPLKTLDLLPNNLPAQLSTFIGREKEVGQIKKRLEKNRLVTLTGSGGVGKTRLSIQVASELLEAYPNGVWLVELASITDPALVPQAVCTALDITVPGSTPALNVLMDYLRSKKLLIVIDNCEHLIDACAHLCDSLLHACPNLHIIGSSREALGIDGENAYHVPSLSLPDPKSGFHAIEVSEAVKLFVERATAILPEFKLTESNASSVAQICRRLDGIALAIELAASRVKILKVEQIASRLDDAFRLLTGGSRTALPRQQTLRALIDWSYNLLSTEEQSVLRRLSVFMGGWTLEAAESLGDNPNMLDLLTYLVDKSLVAVDLEHGDEPRYILLETIRQYAREKLAKNGESETVRNRHMEYFCQLVERFEPGLRGPDQAALLDHLEMELDNLRAALEWSLNHDVHAGLRMASRLRWFWHLRDHPSEGAGWLDKLFSVEAEGPSFQSDSDSDAFDRAKALLVLAFLVGTLGKIQKAMLCLRESLALCEKMSGRDGVSLLAECHEKLGMMALISGDLDQAKILAEKSLELFRRSGNKFGIAEAQVNGPYIIALHSGELETARILNESNLAIRHELGDKEGIAYGFYNGGIVAISQGDYERAQKLFSAAIEICREARSDYLLTGSLGNLGGVYLFRGEKEQAREYFLQVAKLAQEKWDPGHKATSIYWLAMYSFEQKQFRKFIQLNSFLEGENHKFIYRLFFPMIQIIFQRNVAAARAELGEEIFEREEAEGKAMTLDQAFAYALEGVNG